MKFCALQMSIKDGDGDYNRNTVSAIIAKYAGSNFYLLPELWSTGYCQSQWMTLAKTDTPKSIQFMQELAKLNQAWVGGSVIFLENNKLLRNRFVLVNPKGKLAGHYDKAHLFTLMEEHHYLAPGSNLMIYDIEGYKVAPTICYDLRFPEMYRRLALQGVDVFLVSAEWPSVRKNALVALALARALESQAYLILSNRIGMNANNELFAGESMIVGPAGVLNSIHEQDNAAAVYDISKFEQDKFRKLLPVFEHRMIGIDYG